MILQQGNATPYNTRWTQAMSQDFHTGKLRTLHHIVRASVGDTWETADHTKMRKW